MTDTSRPTHRSNGSGDRPSDRRVFRPSNEFGRSASTVFRPRQLPPLENTGDVYLGSYNYTDDNDDARNDDALNDAALSDARIGLLDRPSIRPRRSRSSRRSVEFGDPASARRQLRLAPEPVSRLDGGGSGPVAGLGFRFVAVMLVVCLAAGLLIWRLAYLQVLHPDRYVDYGRDQRIRTIELPAGRGDLLDRNGDQLATSLPRTTFFTDPGFVLDPAGVLSPDEYARRASNQLAPILGLPAEELFNRLTADNSFGYLARQIDDDTAEAIEALDIEGVFSLLEPARFNPAGERLASGVLGRVGIDNQGLSGLEYAFDDALTGVPGQIVLERDQQGHTIPHGEREVVTATQGSDVVLTIDRSLQFEVERLLLDQVVLMGAKGGVVVVTEPATGEVLAMASVERDDQFVAYISSNNLSTTWAFEPGSVMKALTFAAVIDEGVATPNTTLNVPDRYQVYDREFSDHDLHDDEVLSVRDIVTRSSNVGTVLWAEALGATAFDSAMRDFGFGSTELGLPGEAEGVVRSLDDYDGTTLAASALGQGIAVSASQMLAAYNVIANDGVYVPLRLVREVRSTDGDLSIPETSGNRQVVSTMTAREMRSVLRDVVAVGTGTAAQIDGYEVAGKTGTARKPQPEGGYLDAEGNFDYVSTFVGFLPANQPKLSVLVAIDEPAASIYASVVAAPTFADIARYSLRHFQIPPAPALVVGSDNIAMERSNFVPLNTSSDSTESAAEGE